MLAPLDRGVRLVYATGQANFDDDLDLPFKVYVNLSPPSFMRVAFVMLHGGSEEIIARAESLEWAEDFLKRNNLEWLVLVLAVATFPAVYFL